MKPVKLTMQAFGSYGNKTEIDFTLPRQNLFLIAGDTGAGKSTIFDAIVFALYGEAGSSANKKDGEELQSQYVSYGTEPFVELTFLEKEGEEEKIYFVRRVPKHIRPKKRKRTSRKKDGIKLEGSDQWIIINESVTLILPDGEDYSQSVKEVNRKLEEILGLTKSQFMQVVMIAQGEFMELLRAKSDEKKAIFRKLFHTQIYQDIVEELLGRKKEAQTDIDRIRTALQTEVGHIIIPDERLLPGYEDLAHSLMQRKRSILAADNLSVTDLEQLFIQLEDFEAGLQELVKTAAERMQEASEKRDRLRDAQKEAEELKKQYQQLDEAATQLKQFSEQEESIKDTQKKADRIKASVEIRTVFQRWQDAVKTERQLGDKIESEQKLLPQLREKAQHLEAVKNVSSGRHQQILEESSKEEERVRKALVLFEEISRAEEALAKAKQNAAAAEEAHREAEKNLEEHQKKEAEWRKRSGELENVPERVALWKGKCERLQSLKEELDAARKNLDDVEKQKKKCEKASEDYREKREAFGTVSDEYNKKYIAFLDAQAGYIAREKLIPGQPCPVCGSVSHPAPCQLRGDDSHLTREGIEELEQEKLRMQTQAHNSSSQMETANGILRLREQALQQSIGRLMERFPAILGAEGEARFMQPSHVSQASSSGMPLRHSEISGTWQISAQGDSQDSALETAQRVSRGSALASAQGVSQDSALASAQDPLQAEQFLQEAEHAYQLQKNELQKEGQELKKLSAQLEQVRGQLAKAAQQKPLLERAVEEASAKLSQARADLAGRTAQRAQMESSGDYPTRDAALKSRENARKRRDQAEAEWKKAADEAAAASSASDRHQALLRSYQEDLPEARAVAESRQQEYQRVMEEKGLTPEQWEEALRQYGAEDAVKFQKQVEAFQKNKAAAAAREETAKAMIAGRALVDMEQLTTDLDTASQQVLAAQEKLEQLRDARRSDRQMVKILGPMIEQRAQALENQLRIDNLYALLAGKKTGSRMDVETFVQRQYMERILVTANRRFSEMSGGQYQLRMVDESMAGSGKNKGLDLMVYSAVTGREREVRTLSGGESFMAALSLALGMADQIRESVSSVNLDILFIDEGFGSLDDHARDQAVKVLSRMAGGERLIGIISHVSELKQEIEEQLLVTKDEKGSHVQWEL